MLTDYILPLLAAFGGFAVLLGLLAYLSKLITEHWLSKGMESYKQGLADASAKDLDRHRAALERESFKFTGLHTKRAEVLAGVYVRIRRVMKGSYGHIDFVIDRDLDISGKEEAFTRFKEAEHEFAEYYGDNRIFLGEDTCKLIDEFSQAANKAVDKYRRAIDNGLDSFTDDELRALDKEVWGHQNKADNALLRLEEDMRDILGDEPSKGHE